MNQTNLRPSCQYFTKSVRAFTVLESSLLKVKTNIQRFTIFRQSAGLYLAVVLHLGQLNNTGFMPH